MEGCRLRSRTRPPKAPCIDRASSDAGKKLDMVTVLVAVEASEA
jgi:hypothetical protein